MIKHHVHPVIAIRIVLELVLIIYITSILKEIFPIGIFQFVMVEEVIKIASV